MSVSMDDAARGHVGNDPIRPGIGLSALVQNPSNLAHPLSQRDREVLRSVLPTLGGAPFVLLTGAGLSTDSGIPDYRGPNAAVRHPLTYQEFVGDESLRKRYWARNHIGWSTMRHAEPNIGHFAVAAMEHAGLLTGVITQNVDRLHEGAGAKNVVDLHGRFDKVACLQCGEVYSRAFIAVILAEINPGFFEAVAGVGGVPMGPDADADLEHEDLIGSFKVACCPQCGGMLKPDFVFFGENVPKDRVDRAFDMLDSAGALLVAGSSLTVMSGLRFVRKAAKLGKPVVIVNRGSTRGDEFAWVKVEAGVSESLTFLFESLAARLA
ncbi:NAD-dependent protein deacetylase [Arthrobacter cryoconiti]|uniref:protein acetyllysine N-acetyltransferase n=1 Tax=Arthrobacter cryoconiti TaxID=748907 RepID=A0ABV8QWE9_9MICC|nr:NAD-dependent protein deacetylase [Arthrobacter cryoconiti]MCC9068778.1 NAD-dependent protein deacetylase [Arthrobacter cryoconiti]